MFFLLFFVYHSFKWSVVAVKTITALVQKVLSVTSALLRRITVRLSLYVALVVLGAVVLYLHPQHVVLRALVFGSNLVVPTLLLAPVLSDVFNEE